MYRLLVALFCTVAMTVVALAAGTHEGGHGHMASPAGAPGHAKDTSRVIEVIMLESDDGAMLFEPATVTVRRNETIRFTLKNAGELAHEFVVGNSDEIAKHKKMMEMAGDSHMHSSGNALRVETRKSADLVWRFADSGMFEFACLIPGHYEAGMKGTLHVSSN